jgi:hypothetical protein
MGCREVVRPNLPTQVRRCTGANETSRCGRWRLTGISAEILERTFTGFLQLNAENEGMSWWKMLVVSPNATVAEIETAYRACAKFAHPDQPGGSHEAMSALNAAREQGLNVAKHRIGK